MTKAQLTSSALALDPRERQELVDALWASLESTPAPLPDWQRELLEERLAKLESDPEEGSRWEDVRARIWPGGR